VKTGADKESGSWSSGEFGTLVIDLFLPATAADFRPKGQETINHRTAKVYTFAVTKEHSHWRIQGGTQWILPAYKGTIWIDKETYRALRIETEAINMPQAFILDHTESAADYDFVTIKDANEVNLINAFFGGGPSLTDCVDISESGTTTGGIRVTGRILYQQCSQMIDNTITGITISSSSVAGDFDYEFHGTQGQKYIDSPSAAGGTTINGNIINPTIKSGSGQRYVCVTSTGQLVSSATACSGT